MDEGFFRTLPATATSPFALVAYLATLFAWLFLGYQTRKLNNLRQVLKENKDGRTIDLIAQLTGIRVPAKMSAEDFIRVKRQEYIFWAVIVLIVALVAISIVNVTQPQQSALGWILETYGQEHQFVEMRKKVKASNNYERTNYLASLKGRKVENWTGWVDGFTLNGSRIKIDMDEPGILSVHDVEFDLPPDAVGKFAIGQRVVFSGTIELATSQTSEFFVSVTTLRLYLRDVTIQPAQ